MRVLYSHVATSATTASSHELDLFSITVTIVRSC